MAASVEEVFATAQQEDLQMVRKLVFKLSIHPLASVVDAALRSSDAKRTTESKFVQLQLRWMNSITRKVLDIAAISVAKRAAQRTAMANPIMNDGMYMFDPDDLLDMEELKEVSPRLIPYAKTIAEQVCPFPHTEPKLSYELNLQVTALYDVEKKQFVPAAEWDRVISEAGGFVETS